MRIPKILPWLVRKAGIAETHAEELWAEAARYATEKTGGVESSAHSEVAVSKLLKLIQTGKKASRKRQDDDARWPSLSRSPFCLISRHTIGAESDRLMELC